MGNQIDFGRAFGAPFKDPQWFGKTAMGGLWGILGVTLPALYGAQIEYIRKVSAGDESLPTWDDFGNKWVKGLLASIGMSIYLLPGILVLSFSFVPMLIGSMGAGMSGDDAAIAAGAGIGLGATCLMSVIGFVLMMAGSLLAMAGYVHFAMRGNFGAFFEFKEIMAKVKGGYGYWIAWLYAMVYSAIVSTVAGALGATIIGIVAAPWVGFIGGLMMSHAFGQYAANAYGSAAMPQAYAPPPPPGGYAPPPPPPAPGGYAPPPPPPATY